MVPVADVMRASNRRWPSEVGRSDVLMIARHPAPFHPPSPQPHPTDPSLDVRRRAMPLRGFDAGNLVLRTWGLRALTPTVNPRTCDGREADCPTPNAATAGATHHNGRDRAHEVQIADPEVLGQAQQAVGVGAPAEVRLLDRKSVV